MSPPTPTLLTEIQHGHDAGISYVKFVSLRPNAPLSYDALLVTSLDGTVSIWERGPAASASGRSSHKNMPSFSCLTRWGAPSEGLGPSHEEQERSMINCACWLTPTVCSPGSLLLGWETGAISQIVFTGTTLSEISKKILWHSPEDGGVNAITKVLDLNAWFNPNPQDGNPDPRIRDWYCFGTENGRVGILDPRRPHALLASIQLASDITSLCVMPLNEKMREKQEDQRFEFSQTGLLFVGEGSGTLSCWASPLLSGNDLKKERGEPREVVGSDGIELKQVKLHTDETEYGIGINGMVGLPVEAWDEKLSCVETKERHTQGGFRSPQAGSVARLLLYYGTSCEIRELRKMDPLKIGLECDDASMADFGLELRSTDARLCSAHDASRAHSDYVRSCVRVNDSKGCCLLTSGDDGRISAWSYSTKTVRSFYKDDCNETWPLFELAADQDPIMTIDAIVNTPTHERREGNNSEAIVFVSGSEGPFLRVWEWPS